MKKIRIAETHIGFESIHYQVLFQDDNGQSTLARVRSRDYAERIAENFRLYLKLGFLLKPHKSAYKIMK
jgi:hypothetical protein